MNYLDFLLRLLIRVNCELFKLVHGSKQRTPLSQGTRDCLVDVRNTYLPDPDAFKTSLTFNGAQGYCVQVVLILNYT